MEDDPKPPSGLGDPIASASSSVFPSFQRRKPQKKTKPKAPQAPTPRPAVVVVEPIAAEAPSIRYPPFPPVPQGVEVIPFAQFKEHGIQLYRIDDKGDLQDNRGIEVDGLGIPTIPLRAVHDTDECKTFTRGSRKVEEDKGKAKLKEKEKEKEKEKGKKKEIATKPLTKTERALQRRQQRILLFAKTEWYDQWADGEAMRGTRIYDSNMSIIDRVHNAASDFRCGRIWPLASSGLGYLWDQFRLYAGLLGQPPVWYRTDLQQCPDDAVDDENDDEELLFAKSHVAQKKDEHPRKAWAMSDDESSGDDDDEETVPQPAADENEEDGQPQQRKALPARTPYALYNIKPIALSSQSQVKALLYMASLRKHQKLLAFLSSPDNSLSIFFSWYLHYQGFIYSPKYLAYLPRLVLFFLEFLLRTKAIRESERSLKKAIEITKKALVEIPAAGKMCRLLPDKMGMGCTLLWGKQWVDEDQPFSFEKREVETKEEAMRRFEEELEKENVQIMAAENVLPPERENDKDGDDSQDQDHEDGSKIVISVQESPFFPDADQIPTAFIEEVVEENVTERDTIKAQETQEIEENKGISVTMKSYGSPPKVTASFETPSSAHAHGETTSKRPKSPETGHSLIADEPIPSRWDTAFEDPTSQENKSSLEAWIPKATQPLMSLFGMTVLPLKYNAGPAERSMRRVREVVAPGEKSKEPGLERNWRGVQGDLVERLTRVVLEPWLDWNHGGIAEAYKKPRVQIPKPKNRGETEKEGDKEILVVGEKDEKVHEPLKDVITILVEPRVAEQLSAGMGLVGTWVQMIRVHEHRKEGAVEGRGRGGFRGYRARGTGRGRGRGGAPVGGNDGRPDDISTIQATVDENTSDAITDSKDANAGHPGEAEPGPSSRVESLNEPEPESSTPIANPAGRGGWRGRGRGRGRGGYHYSQSGEKEFNFWYVEDLLMAIPSFWTPGEEEVPYEMPEGDEDDDLPDKLVD